MVPGTTPSNIGWVASVAQVPSSASNGSRAGSLSVMSRVTIAQRVGAGGAGSTEA